MYLAEVSITFTIRSLEMQIELSDIIKLYNRIDELEKRVSLLEEQVLKQQSTKLSPAERPAFPAECANSKYKALSEFLYENWEKRITLSYEKLESILGFSLPASAHNLPQSYSPKDVAELFNEIKGKTVFIRGNCDARIDEMVLGVTMYDILEENYFNHHFVFSHGDILDKLNFNITSNTIICTGHTHVHNIRFHKNILFLNPGSLSMPKKETAQSFMIIDEEGVYLHNLKNEIISTFKFNK